MNSPDWQIEWFRNHWRSYWDIKLRNRATLCEKLNLPAVETREDFSAYLKSLNYNSFLDESQIVCVELTIEEYAEAYFGVSSIK